MLNRLKIIYICRYFGTCIRNHVFLNKISKSKKNQTAKQLFANSVNLKKNIYFKHGNPNPHYSAIKIAQDKYTQRFL